MAGVNVSINVPKKVSMTAKVKDTSGTIERYGSKSSSQANATTTSSQTETIDLDDVVNPSSNANQTDSQTSVDPTTIQENQQNDVSVEEVKAASQEQEPVDTTVQQNTTTQNTNQAETQTTANSQGNINSNTKVEMNASTNSNGTTSASTGNLGTSQANSMNQTGTSSKSQGNISMGGSTNTNGNATSIEMNGIETSNTSGEKSMQVGIDVSTETTQTEGVSSQVELDAEEYKIQLSKVGLREEDIERVISGEITIEELLQEIENDEQDRSRYEEILIASYLQSAGLDCTTLEEVSQKIDENQQKLEALQEEKRSLENGSNEEEAWQRILGRLQSGESLENILESEIVAYQYQDEDGNTKYVYDDPYASGVIEDIEYEYTPLTYEEMYGDEKIKELEQVLTEIDPLFGDTFHSWDGSDSQYEYLDNYFKSLENKNTDEQMKQLEEEIDALINQNAQYKAYQNGIQEEVDYYMNYIDPYTRKEDLGQYSFEQEGIEEDLTKILDMTNYEGQFDSSGNLCDFSYQGANWDGSSNTITITSEETLMKVLCAMINDSSQLTNNETSLMNKDGTIFIQATDKMLDNYEEWAPLMTDEEKSIFNYIYQKEGYETAYKYLSDITNEMDNRWLSNQTQKDQEFASEHPVLSSIASVFVTPIEGISAACASLNALITNQQILRTDVYSAGDTWRAKISQDLIENYDNGELWSFIYNTGMSMSDSVSLIGISALTGGVATPALSAVLMGSRSYVSTINDALDRGLSDGQAVALAFSSAVVESAMESYSVSHLLNLESKLGQNTVKLVGKIANSIEDDTLANVASKLVYVGASTLSQAFVEGEEEFATEVLNYLFDEVISGDLSNRSQQINQALENGYTIEEAEKMANISFLDQLQQAFIGGFVSGVCFGVFGGVKITHNVSTSIATQIMDEYQVSRSEVSDMLSNLGVSEAQAFASQIEARQQMEMEEENQAKQEQREKMQGFLNYLFDQDVNVQAEFQEEVAKLDHQISVETSNTLLGTEVQDFTGTEEFVELKKKLQSFNDGFINPITPLENFGSAVKQQNGKYKIYPIKSDNYVDMLTNYCLDNHLTFEENQLAIKDVMKQLNQEIYDDIMKNGMDNYYGNTTFIHERIEAIMDGLADMFQSDFFTADEHAKIQDAYLKASSCVASVQSLFDIEQDAITYEIYDQIEQAYVTLEAIENDLSKLNEKRWKQFFEAKNAKFVHVLSGKVVPVNVMDKVCTTLVTDTVMPLAGYGHVGYEFGVDMDHILSLCPEDSGSWDVGSESSFSRKFISLEEGIITSWQNSGSGYWFETGSFSQLYSPEYVEKYSLDANLRANGEILNYKKYSAYSEIFMLNKDHSLKATKAFYTDEATQEEIDEIKRVAELQGLEVEKLSLDEARIRNNLPPLDLESTLNQYTAILDSDPRLATIMTQIEQGQDYQVPDDLLKSFDELMKLYGKIQGYIALTNSIQIGEIDNHVSLDETIDDEPELAFFDIFNSKKENVKEYEGTIESHSNGVQYVPFINQHIQQNGGCKITVNSTAEISSTMLNQISDLSKLQVQILDGLGDGNGHLRQKYNSTKYQNRTTYTGLEMQKIIGEIEYLESRVDKSLPTYDRAKQLYEVIASHFSYNHSFDQYKNGHLITASLRGITDYNEIGKKGLVCAGFSSLYSELCKRLDIDCEYVRGKGYGHDDGKAEKHVWNVLKIDGQIIPVDVTWKSCNFSNDWFGPSEEFQRRHVADEDEIYKQYNISNSLKSTLNSTLTQDDISTILSAIGITDAVHGYGYGIRALKRYLQTNEAVGFTRTDNARYNIQKIDSSVIRNYFEVMQQDILEAIEAHNQKYNGSGIASYKAFLQDGNYNHITSSNGARNLVKKYSITELNILDQIYPLTGREIQLSETFEKLSDTEIQTISRSILTMDSIYGRNAGIKALRRYMSTGSDLEFTRTGGTRDLMKKIPALPLKKYFEQMSRDMNHVIQIHDAKYPGAGMSSFNAFLQDGNYNHITSSNGARTIAQKYSIKELKILQKLWDYLREEEI